MTNINELKENRAKLMARAKEAHEADNAETFANIEKEIADLNGKIERSAKIDAFDRAATGEPVTGTGDNRFDEQVAKFSLRKAMADQLPDMDVDAGLEREVSAELRRRDGVDGKGIRVPLSVFEQRVTVKGGVKTGHRAA
tara:strand:- start:4 stop:423 length:420 start_codon:yes stop_codon:yes gene_type:complete